MSAESGSEARWDNQPSSDLSFEALLQPVAAVPPVNPPRSPEIGSAGDEEAAASLSAALSTTSRTFDGDSEAVVALRSCQFFNLK